MCSVKCQSLFWMRFWRIPPWIRSISVVKIIWPRSLLILTSCTPKTILKEELKALVVHELVEQGLFKVPTPPLLEPPPPVEVVREQFSGGKGAGAASYPPVRLSPLDFLVLIWSLSGSVTAIMSLTPLRDIANLESCQYAQGIHFA